MVVKKLMKVSTWCRYVNCSVYDDDDDDNDVDCLLFVVFDVTADWDVDISFILLVVDNRHLIVPVDVTVDVVFLVGDVNGEINFLVGNDNDGVVFIVGDAVYDLRVVVPDGISHNTPISPPLPSEKLHTSF